MSAQQSVLAKIAQPYASALFDLASEAGSVAVVETGLIELSKLAGESDDFSRFLRSPVITADVKRSALDAILARTPVDPLVERFLRAVAKNGRLFALPAIIAAYRALAAKSRGEVTAEVISATPLSREQVSHLAETLKARIGKTVTLDERVDPSLIGGLVVKVGSQMIDSSLKTKLTAMKIAMKEVG